MILVGSTERRRVRGGLKSGKEGVVTEDVTAVPVGGASSFLPQGCWSGCGTPGSKAQTKSKIWNNTPHFRKLLLIDKTAHISRKGGFCSLKLFCCSALFTREQQLTTPKAGRCSGKGRP